MCATTSGSLPSALLHHAASRPEEPWLFYRRGWDWPWLPWVEVAARVAAWALELAVLPAGTRAAFAAWPGPPALALDLALEGAGLVSIPVPAEASGAVPLDSLAASRAEVWVEREGIGAPEGVDLPRHRLSAWQAEGPSGLGPRLESRDLLERGPERVAGGAVVAGGRELSAADLWTAAEEVAALLAPPSRRRGREILVSARPLSDPAERRLLAWATRYGAALVLEPHRIAAAATAAWARPTVLSGTAGELALLRRAVVTRRFFRPRLPFGRLHTILLDGDLPDDDRAFWEGWGVRLVGLGG